MNQQKPMVSVEEALDIILSKISSTDIETIPLAEARNRINAHDICSDIDLAPFDNSAMDGFALRAEDIQAASDETPAVLDVVTNIGAGDFFDGEIGKGQAARIMTGAPLPQGANAVELIENTHTSRDQPQGDTVAITRPLSHGENVRRAGEEAHAGDIIVPQNTVLSPAFIGLCASAGAATVAVYKKPRVGIISLGSELIEITKMPDRSH
ncbi:MAG: molybdopterin molybdotransferase MoeA, partial [Eggerthellaceae bacterium]|nr:molybdopterin molybdotransferase MoeA [Eggerthellaceae bacterium]